MIPFLSAARRLTRQLRYGKTIQTTRLCRFSHEAVNEAVELNVRRGGYGDVLRQVGRSLA